MVDLETLKQGGFHRTTKIEIDDGRANSVEEALEIVAGYVLQIEVGIGICVSETRQAMLLTAINAASRAFIGGVRVRFHETGILKGTWAHGKEVKRAAEEFGASIVDLLDPDFPTLVIGDVSDHPIGKVVLYATWEGWSGGVVAAESERLGESLEFPLAGLLAGSLGVSEAFQHLRGNVFAGRRSVGYSLWEPQSDWRNGKANGPPCHYLPKRLWLLGLGHLGQAYAWTLSFLPYQCRSDVDIVLQDFDSVENPNLSTGMLSTVESIGRRKTRVVAAFLEGMGFNTALTERPFDAETRRRPEEPGIALVGFDDPAPRRLIELAGFDLAVDAGLGGGPQNYLDMLIHAFPSGIEAAHAWPDHSNSTTEKLVAEQPAYKDLFEHLRSSCSLKDAEIRCGIIEIAGSSVGAAFVGCIAAAFVFSEVLRFLAGGTQLEILSVSLRSPQHLQMSRNTAITALSNPGFIQARDYKPR